MTIFVGVMFLFESETITWQRFEKMKNVFGIMDAVLKNGPGMIGYVYFTEFREGEVMEMITMTVAESDEAFTGTEAEEA